MIRGKMLIILKNVKKGATVVEIYATIILRTVFFYLLILVIFRLMGKREIGELSVLDLVVFVMIGELAIIAIESPKEPSIHAAVPMVLLMLIQIILAKLSLKSKR